MQWSTQGNGATMCKYPEIVSAILTPTSKGKASSITAIGNASGGVGMVASQSMTCEYKVHACLHALRMVTPALRYLVGI